MTTVPPSGAPSILVEFSRNPGLPRKLVTVRCHLPVRRKADRANSELAPLVAFPQHVTHDIADDPGQIVHKAVHLALQAVETLVMPIEAGLVGRNFIPVRGGFFENMTRAQLPALPPALARVTGCLGRVDLAPRASVGFVGPPDPLKPRRNRIKVIPP